LLVGGPIGFQRSGSLLVALAVFLFFFNSPFFMFRTDAKKIWAVSGMLFEFCLLFLGTLIWGYGDLFHCWINGNGWTTC